MKTYKGGKIFIEAYERGGYYILRVSYYTPFLAATRRRGVYVKDWMWTTSVEKKFARKESANKWFRKAKASNPDMKLVKDEPGKYIDNDEVVSSV